jgi:hypothetical protein
MPASRTGSVGIGGLTSAIALQSKARVPSEASRNPAKMAKIGDYGANFQTLGLPK